MRAILRDLGRLLTFRLRAEQFDAFGRGHLILGLACTWLAGMGRYWDSPRAHLGQQLGLGSLAYVVCLAALLWLVIKPLARTPAFGFRSLLTFLTLTSPPALLYAIPVERYVSMEQAIDLNVWFLTIVALWRVALLAFYLRRAVRLDAAACVLAVLLPISAIIAALALLNLEHAAFAIMGGLRDEDRTPGDGAYGIALLLSVIAAPLFALSFLGWLFFACEALHRWWRDRRTDRATRH
jgi:hypothetical protein